VLRMAGHDFMDYDPSGKAGGSDACTDMSHEDNAGLAACLADGEHGQSLMTSYLIYCKDVSLADFLVIAAEAVMKASRDLVHAENSRAPHVDFASHFKWGRSTATECEGSAERLPTSTDGCPAVEEVFVSSMGLSWRQAAALMGVHSLGRARTENSGYAGWWSDAQNSRKFNNNYYRSIRDKGWVPMKAVCGNTAKNQWVKAGPGGMPSGEAVEMMLDTDLCLAFDIPKGSGGENCCAWQRSAGPKRNVCERGPRADCGSIRRLAGRAGRDVDEFADDEAAWLREFQAAWTKATTNGFSDLHKLQSSCPSGR